MKPLLSFPLILVLALLFSCASETGKNNTTQHADSIQYQIKTMTLSRNDCSPDSANCTYIQFIFPVFTDLNGPLADSIRTLLARSFETPTGSERELDSVQKAFINEYNNLMNSESPTSQSWNFVTSITVQEQNSAWICLEQSSGGYTGGAHDFGYTEYHILDKKTGRRLHLADFFDSTGLQKLTRLGETEFCKVRGIGPHQSLEEAGFDFEDNRFFMPENFCFTKDGLTFLFNSYEVGPYVLGHTEFSIAANQLVNIMKKRKD